MGVQALDMASEFRSPRNMAQNEKGSIHDDAAASKLGFRGGTVAGSIHMDQFPPLLTRIFGEAWLGSGTLSLYFKYATVDREPVKAFARLEAGARQARLSMVKDTGEDVMEGTAAPFAPDPDSELVRRRAAQTPADRAGLRILADVTLGDMGAPAEVRLASAALDARLETITETLPAYHGLSGWAGRVLPPSLVVQLCMEIQRKRLRLASPAVGLFGAIELQFRGGPVLAETDYVSTGRILALSESPKTENVWYESVLSDPADGREVARMVQYLRFLRASSPLYG